MSPTVTTITLISIMTFFSVNQSKKLQHSEAQTPPPRSPVPQTSPPPISRGPFPARSDKSAAGAQWAPPPRPSATNSRRRVAFSRISRPRLTYLSAVIPPELSPSNRRSPLSVPGEYRYRPVGARSRIHPQSGKSLGTPPHPPAPAALQNAPLMAAGGGRRPLQMNIRLFRTADSADKRNNFITLN